MPTAARSVAKRVAPTLDSSIARRFSGRKDSPIDSSLPREELSSARPDGKRRVSNNTLPPDGLCLEVALMADYSLAAFGGASNRCARS